jgi:hypothetical protein
MGPTLRATQRAHNFHEYLKEFFSFYEWFDVLNTATIKIGVFFCPVCGNEVPSDCMMCPVCL